MKRYIQGGISIYSMTLTSDGGKSVDITNLFVEMSIYEDIFSNGISGHVKLVDSFHLPETLPIIAEETLTVSFNSNKDSKWQFTKSFRINRIEKYTVDENENLSTYVLQFVSPMFELNQKLRLNMSFGSEQKGMLASDIVTEVATKHMGIPAKELKVEKSRFDRHVICGNWTPYQLFNFLARTDILDAGAVENNKMSSFLFFEDRDGFKFVSIASMVENKLHSGEDLFEAINFRPKPDQNKSKTMLTTENQVLSYDIVSWQDSLDNTISGLHSSRNIYHDIINKTITVSDLLYKDAFNQMTHVDDKLAYPLESNRKTMPKESTLVLPSEYHYANDLKLTRKWKQERNIAIQELKNYNIVAVVNGSTRYKVGMVVDCHNIHSTRRKPNDTNYDYENLNGKYVVTKIRHDFTKHKYVQALNLAKGSMKRI